jgi:pyridoxal phosphate enzyme (YggS family)
MTTIADNLQKVRERIAAACARAGRAPDSVALLAVSKTFGADCVEQAFAAGQRAFGENYIQEGVDKIAALQRAGIEWHCIGPVQSNKTRLVAANFDWVHSVDRLKIAQRLSEQRPAGLAPLNVCIQVNIDAASSKSGVAVAQVRELADGIAALDRLRLRGLMTIPTPDSNPEGMALVHRRTRALFDALCAAGLPLDTLSMGMTADLETAVLCGSTMVRIGTAIFGARSYAAGQSPASSL